MSYDWAACAERQHTGSSRTKAVLVALASRADAGGYCWPSIKDIAERTELSPATVRRALDDLELNEYISRRQRFVRGRQTSNGYVLNLDWSIMSRPPLMDDDANAEVSEGAHHDTPGVLTMSRGGAHHEQPGTSQRTSQTNRSTRSSAARFKPASRRVRPEDHGDDEAPALGASPRREQPADVERKPATLTSMKLALRLQRALRGQTGSAATVDCRALASQLSRKVKAGTHTIEQLAACVDVYAAAPDRYRSGDMKGWTQFLAALPKLEADAEKHHRATAPASELYGDDPYANEVD